MSLHSSSIFLHLTVLPIMKGASHSNDFRFSMWTLLHTWRGQHRWCCSFTTAALTPEKAILNSAQSRSQQELSAGEQVLLGVQICSMLTLLTILHALKYFKNTFTLLIKLMENSGFLIYSVLLKVLHETVTLWKRTPWLYITVEKTKTVQVSSESQLPVKSPVQFIKQID